MAIGDFKFIPGWTTKTVDDPLDAKMNETLRIGLGTAWARVHVVTGYLRNSIQGEYNKSTKTIAIHADAPYSWVEEFRSPGDHHYLLPAMQAMAGFWGGKFNLEAQFTNAAPKGKSTTIESLRAREEAGRRSQLGFLARRKAKIVTRRWHKRFDDDFTSDPTTPVL